MRRWPCVIAEFAGMRNGMEAPAKRARAHIVGADVAGRRRKGLGHFSAHDNEVLVDEPGRVHGDGVGARVAAKVFARSILPSSPKLEMGLPV